MTTPDDPRRPDPEHLIAVGESQSAGRLVTYIDAVHPLVDVYDGFLVHSRGRRGARAVAGSAAERVPVPTPTPIRDDLDVPVLVFQTETDVFDSNLNARQPDTDRTGCGRSRERRTSTSTASASA